jgi:hypothetical protein
MSALTLDQVKNYLDVIHAGDDEKLQLLLEAAEDEARNYMDRDNLTDWYSCPCSEPASEPVSEVPMPASVKLGILILVQAAYQAAPAEQEQLRKVAEIKLHPYRCRLGV